MGWMLLIIIVGGVLLGTFSWVTTMKGEGAKKGDNVFETLKNCNDRSKEIEEEKIRKLAQSQVDLMVTCSKMGVDVNSIPQGNKSKDASVVGRAVAGGIVAGPTGAVVGAISAVDKNMKNKK